MRGIAALSSTRRADFIHGPAREIHCLSRRSDESREDGSTKAADLFPLHQQRNFPFYHCRYLFIHRDRKSFPNDTLASLEANQLSSSTKSRLSSSLRSVSGAEFLSPRSGRKIVGRGKSASALAAPAGT